MLGVGLNYAEKICIYWSSKNMQEES
uniref:Uncharacterized protein n=1 Tax=Arundo donax TaxID=35708 RepID=A0A0A9FMJ8_ARUDO